MREPSLLVTNKHSTWYCGDMINPCTVVVRSTYNLPLLHICDRYIAITQSQVSHWFVWTEDFSSTTRSIAWELIPF